MRRHVREGAALGANLIRWMVLGAVVGVLGGLASAAFLIVLERATGTRERLPGLLFGLPLAGVAIGLLYDRVGKAVAGGNNLLLDEIHEPTGRVPFRMAPLVLVTTVVTHLFGGSAGREGTAVQMGGALADLVAGTLRFGKEDRRLLLMAGISAGFGSVFGTPLAGCVFGLEVLALGRLESSALVPCLAASVVGDLTTRACGVTHVGYAAPHGFAFEGPTFLRLIVASLLFALAGAGFAELTHALGRVGKGIKGAAWLRPFVGGLVVIAMTLLVGDQTYNGLGIPLIQRSFTGTVPLDAFALKLLFTAVTLGAGFKGGEVTPLFCIGATLGNAFAQVAGGDPALYAALGFVAVFSGAANTPLACTIMGIELFGAPLAVPLAVACAIAYVFSGHRGIYTSQRVFLPKAPFAGFAPGTTLREIGEAARAAPKASEGEGG